MKTRVSVKYFSCEWFSLETFVLTLPQPDPLKLSFFDNFGNSKAFHTFNPELGQLSCKNKLKFDLLDFFIFFNDPGEI